MIVDKLYESVAKKGVVCVGLDTDISYVPEYLQKEVGSAGEAVFLFNKAIIDATEDVAGCYKVQIAYYESLGLEGMEAYRKTLAYLRDKKLISIADIKRGDIAKTAEMYAKGHFEGDFEADFVTLAPYMGMDSVTPYLPYVKEKEKGLFILVRTSNPGSRDFQYLQTEKEMPLYDVVGTSVQQVGKEFLGECGFSSVGAVIGGTTGEEAESIRSLLDTTFFLIPGYGAQGGKAEDIAKYLVRGNGGVVNSSRAVLLAYRKAGAPDTDFAKEARNEVLRMREEIQNACEALRISRCCGK